MDGCRLFRYVVLWSVVVGILNRQCPDGFYGSSCQHKCPVTCNNKQCKIDEFGRASCVDGCVDGYRGTSCKIPCPGNCQLCERVNGSCISCKDTFHGTNCTLTCEELCQGFRCDTDQTCSKTVCLDGRYGQNCSNKCYPRYLTCTRSIGNCTACRDGYYGQSCELDCPPCGFTDGSVDQTCKDGCNTISCSDITGGDCGKSLIRVREAVKLRFFPTTVCLDAEYCEGIPLTVFVPVVLLLVIVIAVILCLWWRSHNKIIRKKRETDEEVQQRMLEEHTKRKKRETGEEVQQRMLEEHTERDMSNAELTSELDSTWYLVSEADLIATSEASDSYSQVTLSSTDHGYKSRTTSQCTGSVYSRCATCGTPHYVADESRRINIVPNSDISLSDDSEDETAL